MIGRRWAFWPILAAGVFFGAGTRAHDWYPLDCCGGYDCGPATMRTVAGALYYAGSSYPPDAVPAFVSEVTVTYKAGPDSGAAETVIVPPNFPRRTSPDGRMHACVVAHQLRCLFMPPAM